MRAQSRARATGFLRAVTYVHSLQKKSTHFASFLLPVQRRVCLRPTVDLSTVSLRRVEDCYSGYVSTKVVTWSFISDASAF